MLVVERLRAVDFDPAAYREEIGQKGELLHASKVRAHSRRSKPLRRKLVRHDRRNTQFWRFAPTPSVENSKAQAIL